MRLIDADEYYKEICRVFPCKYRDDENIRRATEIGLSNMPTVEVVPMSVIEDINKELEARINYPCINQNMMAQNLAYREVQKIIKEHLGEVKHDTRN